MGKGIGILGGTFDPIHIGHLIVAQSALEAHELSRVIFVPCYLSPHKDPAGTAPAEHRFAMTCAAIEGDPRLEASDLELRRGGVSYTVETLQAIKREHPSAEMNFIIGSDTLLDLHSWHRIDRILELCTFLTFARPGFPIEKIREKDVKLPPPWPERLLSNAFVSRIVDISSSEIRHRLAEGMSIRYLVPDPVAMYIAEHNLYI